jgi:hypothetical protein
MAIFCIFKAEAEVLDIKFLKFVEQKFFLEQLFLNLKGILSKTVWA